MEENILGEKVLIRPTCEEDFTYLLEWWNDPEVMRHVGFPCGLKISKPEVLALLSSDDSEISNETKTYRLMIIDNLTKSPIGEMNYSNLNIDLGSASIGIKIGNKAYQNRGFGEDALIHILSFLFSKYNLSKIKVDTLGNNIRAQRLYEKVGFRRVNVIKRGYFISSTYSYEDIILYEISRSSLLSEGKNL